MTNELERTTDFTYMPLSEHDEEYLRFMSELKDEFDRAVLAAMPRLAGAYFEARRQNQPDPEILQQLRAAAAQLGNAGLPIDGHTLAQAILRAEKATPDNAD